MTEHFADRLRQSIDHKGIAVCVGLDPVFERLPAELRRQPESKLSAIRDFGRRIIEIVAPLVPAIKINSAFFERHLGPGITTYFELVRLASDHGLIVIGDCKRGDVGHTAEQYARAHLSDADDPSVKKPDAVTLHSYMGFDALRPFIDVAREEGKGIFVLVQTSNESAQAIQCFCDGQGTTLAEHVGAMVDTWATRDKLLGRCGDSCVGAVVAPTQVNITRKLRACMPRSIFLVPGFGAQGLSADSTQACFRSDGRGALVNASRSVIFAYENKRFSEQHPTSWEKCVESACRQFISEIAAVTR